MKTVPIKDLKENLSRYAEEAANGELIEVTKHNRPYILLSGARTGHLHVGRMAGRGILRSTGKALSRGKYLQALLDDRQ